jgi:hypothetical protein
MDGTILKKSYTDYRQLRSQLEPMLLERKAQIEKTSQVLPHKSFKQWKHSH